MPNKWRIQGAPHHPHPSLLFNAHFFNTFLVSKDASFKIRRELLEKKMVCLPCSLTFVVWIRHCFNPNARPCQMQVDGELSRRLEKLSGVARDCETFKQTSESFERGMNKAKREIDEFRRYIGTSEDFGPVLNSLQVHN